MARKRLDTITPSALAIDSLEREMRYELALDFAESLARFTDENFSAAAKVEFPPFIRGYISVSLVLAAKFWRALLAAVAGETFVTARIENVADELWITITGERGIEVEMKDCFYLIKTARAAGFKPYFEAGVFQLRTALRLSRSAAIYAPGYDGLDLYRILCKLMFE